MSLKEDTNSPFMKRVKTVRKLTSFDSVLRTVTENNDGKSSAEEEDADKCRIEYAVRESGQNSDDGIAPVERRPQQERKSSMMSLNEDTKASLMKRVKSVRKLASFDSVLRKGAVNDEKSTAKEEDADKRRIEYALREAGQHSDGIAAAEVWILDSNEEHGVHLKQPDGGWWRSQSFTVTDPKALEALERIEKTNRNDYVPPQPQLLGTGLAGRLWTEQAATARHSSIVHLLRWDQLLPHHQKQESSTSRSDRHLEMTLGSDRGRVHNHASRHFSDSSLAHHSGNGGQRRSSSSRLSLTSIRSALGLVQGVSGSIRHMKGSKRDVNGSKHDNSEQAQPGSYDHDSHISHGQDTSALLWRDIHSINVDPDQPTFLRLKLLEDAGFGQAAGVPFESGGTKGILIYFASSDTARDRLVIPENNAYMRSAADFVGAAVALTKPREANVMQSTHPSNDNQLGAAKNDQDGAIIHKIKVWGTKCKGGNLQPPLPMSLNEAMLTFCGAFVTLIIIAGISEAILGVSDGKMGIILGPFGALMTLQYGLVMAPASQPRSIMYGLTVAVSIGLVFSYIPEASVPLWIRVPLATSTAICALVMLGITHPPAGAAALIVSSGEYGWIDLPLILFGGVVSIATATLINNISEKRQYPTFHHFGGSAVIRILQSIYTQGSVLTCIKPRQNTRVKNASDSTEFSESDVKGRGKKEIDIEVASMEKTKIDEDIIAEEWQEENVSADGMNPNISPIQIP